MRAASYKPSDMRHVNHQIRADFFSDSRETFKVQNAAVSRRAGDYKFRLALDGEFFKFVVVNRLGFFADAVGNNIKISSAVVQFHSMT